VIAGLAGITPACGYVTADCALLAGLLIGAVRPPRPSGMQSTGA